MNANQHKQTRRTLTRPSMSKYTWGW